jgi:hypothetical protein
MATKASPLADTVIFSTENGLVWAHLPNTNAPVALGDLGTVAYMMRDFLSQCALSERLGTPTLADGSAPPDNG